MIDVDDNPICPLSDRQQLPVDAFLCGRRGLVCPIDVDDGLAAGGRIAGGHGEHSYLTPIRRELFRELDGA